MPAGRGFTSAPPVKADMECKAGSALLLTETVDKLRKMWEWHNQGIGGNANGDHCRAGEIIGESIMRRRHSRKIVYQQQRP